ncbi:LUT family class A beta-lactamase [Pseudomonas sp. LTJR-52]|uniref:LUT family class A beta-lactamase n=1 Tax=Pseudomonas sp. LTJR-52 TaxID=2479392 RepID=UPI000EFA3A1A|nr:LUT family class A beta-lactamase [Pseudomonas sp. LTJR-52]AYN96462.1 LUT family class A beta-lactamase [Pseudomonas sp. LTJR-52]
MNVILNRRTFLLASAVVSASYSLGTLAGANRDDASFQDRLAKLEQKLNGRLGVCAIDTADGAQLGYRANERFAMNSTFKVMLASAFLARSQDEPGLLEERLTYTRADLVTYSPVTEKHVVTGMTVAELCAAGIQYSDNTAANMLMKKLGGPEAVTAFARSIGDTHFRLDRWETELNSAIPGDPRDTNTPQAMAMSLQRLALGDMLAADKQHQLQAWLKGNTTGGKRIRAGVPAGWQVGDKTGTGDYGSANDVAILWPPRHAPVVLALYSALENPQAEARNDVLADAARIVAEWVTG